MFSANSSQVSEDRLYVEDVFSTYLYTGNGSTQTITNGIDLAGKGGLVWMKDRVATWSHWLFDTARGQNGLNTNNTSAQTSTAFFQSFNSNGFTLNGASQFNVSGNATASWTFRKAPKFFDVVTWTGTNPGGGPDRAIPHSLGTTPGTIIIKRTNGASSWTTWHRSLSSGNILLLNTTDAQQYDPSAVPSVSSTSFSVGYGPNIEFNTYVAYLFAHDTTSDGIIQCGSYTGNGSSTGPTVTLGWEPQWLLVKSATSGAPWRLMDVMRGLSETTSFWLDPSTSDAETPNQGAQLIPTATGFRIASTSSALNSNGQTYIYIAIRRGPMRTPTSGTSVFAPIIYTGNATSGTARTTGFVTDTVWSQQRTGAANPAAYDRLRGSARYLSQSLANAEVTQSGTDLGVSGFDTNNGYLAGADQTQSGINFNGYTYVNWAWRRAPSFYDQVCYTGTETNRSVNHSLGVVPELIIVKQRDTSKAWTVYSSGISNTEYLVLNSTAAKATAATYWNSTTATSTTFSLGTSTVVNSANSPYVAYLFASCPGVSKVGTYTGNGSSQTINCGFAAGARFVMIKRTDSTGDWYVFDTARGMTTLTDPYLLMNSTAAETATLGAVTTTSVGFSVNASVLAAINASGANYIFLSVA